MGISNAVPRYDDAALGALRTTLLQPAVHQGIELPTPASLTVNSLCDNLFEARNWQSFKRFMRETQVWECSACCRVFACNCAS